METFAYEDLAIRYVRAGAGAPIVMLHNGGTSHAIWNDVLPLLEGFEVFALDLLGFGESSKPERGYALERHVAILEAFIEAQSLAPVYLVGNCMGSATNLAYAMQRPDTVRAMVLINTLTAATFARGLYGPIYSLPRRAPAIVNTLSKVALGARLGKLGVRSQLGSYGRERRIHDRPELCACYAGSAQSRALLEVLADIPNYAVLDRFVPPASRARRPSGSFLAWSIPAKTRERFAVALKQRRRTSRSFGGARNEISRVSGYVPRRSSRTPRPVLSRSRVRSVPPSWYPTISAISSTL